jgi:hypothetical protein
MSLRAFHIVFVALSSLLCFGFAGWSLHQYRSGGGRGSLALGLAAAVAGVALLVYGRWFWSKITTRDEELRRRRKNLRKLPIALGVLLAGHALAPGAWACTSCFGGAAGPMIDAARLGVWLLFGFVFVLQLGFASFFVILWRRARRFKRETGAAAALD